MLIRTVLAVVAASWTAAVTLEAQTAVNAAPPATVALVPSLSDPAAAAVVLRRAGDAGDVIMLREADASLEGLAAAVAVLVQSRGRNSRLAGSLRLTVRSASVQQRIPAQVADQLEQVLRRARRSETATLDGVGPARSATIVLTSFRHRAR